ncbi:hypothetical protein CLAFUW4_12711 [Fulvia fulva]|uniref:DUF1275 domain protein n=1 Tax=Passalora fulva TaxID=5499 RepID=A0A9Q8PJA0_PASFU|nr:uncharacterized protein CLAFUR5_12576 [Fulvia fulva]KAK4612273.1 hypothetical protein CLAFUR4_12715 [Fulvia fulva]KAK4612708.1 hypothetical protein CLAFUR0_12721 [Fulvia fulva]UJO23493.1 hypothetical protein CLAFUR5_12576 [Fulvia fulva]WPV21184.1 hypothetical protein CLAFUW4_12711 [Fulvia fulva]WPV36543.1 hypothetical protein CLAFUW7_12718 [Fulvia fulva]
MVDYGTNNASKGRTAPANDVEAGTRAQADASSLQESSSLLGNGSKSNAKSASSRPHAYCTVNVSSAWGDLALLFCYVITGLLDSSSVYTWGSFVSMQTGNTVYLGSGIVAPSDDNKWIRALTSIVFFCLGSFIFSRYHRYFGGKKRWVIVLSYTIQLIMIVVSAVMITLSPAEGLTPKGPITMWSVIPIALIAFQSAGQAVMSRVLQHGGLTSVVLTSIYCDLFSDQKLFTDLTTNAERNRRAAAPLLLLLGAMLGGIWSHSEVGLAGAAWTAAALKLFVIVAWCLWAAEKDENSTE